MEFGIEELKPCPFCGAKGDALGLWDIGEFWVQCLRCAATGPEALGKADAIHRRNNWRVKDEN